MTTPSTAPDAVRPEQAQEDVELLAGFMGWEPLKGSRHMWWDYARSHAWFDDDVKAQREARNITTHHYHFSPFTDANADLMVLERAREVWKRSGKWHDFVMAYAQLAAPRLQPTLTVILQRHECGMYSRAVLAVLRSTETEG